MVHEAPDGPRGQRVLAHPGQREARHRRAHVEGGRVIAERRPALQMDEPLARVQTHRRRHDEAGARAHGQRADVHLELVAPVLAGHEARHHPRVDGGGPVHHHGEPDPRHGAHGPGAEHLDMGMPAPHQHEIVANFAACGHHDVVTERIMALLLALSVGLAGCGNGDTNFSQEPGFAEYFAKSPPASTGRRLRPSRLCSAGTGRASCCRRTIPG